MDSVHFSIGILLGMAIGASGILFFAEISYSEVELLEQKLKLVKLREELKKYEP
jgi:hypothetical protein